MIDFADGVFFLNTGNTSYIFRITKFLHLENIYYGGTAGELDIEALSRKDFLEYGNQVIYDESDRTYCLDNIMLEHYSCGKGDFRHGSMEIKMPDDTFVFDFGYQSHEIVEGSVPVEGMPSAEGADQTLIITLKDRKAEVFLRLYYSVFEDCDVITRRCELVNGELRPLTIRKIMSMQLDLPGADYTLSTFDGAWSKERFRHERSAGCGLFVNESVTGNSSSRHNPFIMLSARGADDCSGECIGINLVYSGNHYEAVDISPYGTTRVMTGINPHCFEWELKTGESFCAPEAVLTYSAAGFNGLSGNMHLFVKKKIVRGEWADKERPILFNNWEGTYFKFNSRKLLRQYRQAKRLGIELCVLDDGWFGDRDSDDRALGDWFVNKKKLRGGLTRLSRKINKMGMKFGLWFEPEMLSVNSRLYEAHPEWAVTVPGRKASLGRKQLVLDMGNPDACAYIFEALEKILKSANIEYVKWDMNRNMSDMYSAAAERQGGFYHRYILGLYGVLDRLTAAFPKILFESCASGGGRYDLGMLCYMPQVWTSDNTDSFCRLSIQGGTSFAYPQCTMGAHYASSPSHQTLRRIPSETRFNVSAFGILGYETDLTLLSKVERNEIKRQTAFYKEHRRLLQFGEFFRLAEVKKDGCEVWMVTDADRSKAIVGMFFGAIPANDGNDALKTVYLDGGKSYKVSVRPQSISLRTLGGLVNFISPVKLRGDGHIMTFVGGRFCLESETQDIKSVSGHLLNLGKVRLNQKFCASGYNKNIRLMGDYDSRLYLIEAV